VVCKNKQESKGLRTLLRYKKIGNYLQHPQLSKAKGMSRKSVKAFRIRLFIDTS